MQTNPENTFARLNEIIPSLGKDEQRMVKQLKTVVDSEAEQKEEFIREFERSPLNALQWAGSMAVNAALAQIARDILSDIVANDELDGPSFVKGILNYHKDNLLQCLIRNQYRGSSSSGFSNEVEHATREAVTTILSRVYGL